MERNKQNTIPLGWLIVVIPTLLAFLSTAHGQTATHVETVGFTVSDMDKAYQVLRTNKVRHASTGVKPS